VRDSFLPFARPLIGDEEIAEVVDTLRSDWITTGPKARRFEQEFAAMIGAPAALAVNSCTAALHLALKTLGIGPGDAVVTTPLTFCSGVHVIEHVGARPILVDVDPDTLNLDPMKVRRALETAEGGSSGGIRVKALMPVHLYGHPCEMDSILEIARDFGLGVIEDAAHALPAKHRGRTIGSLASSIDIPVLTCFSFYAIKNVTTGEGGMLTGRADHVEDARLLSLHGMSHDAWKRYGAEGSWFYEVTQLGFKYNMTDIQAAIGLHQIRKLPEFHARRTAIARRYSAAFSDIAQLQVPPERDHIRHAWHLYSLRLNQDRIGLSRNQFIEELKARNIGTSVHFIPIHLHPYYKNGYGFKPDDFPVAFREYQRMLSLPLYPGMTDQDVQDVISAVTEVARKHSVQPVAGGRHRAARSSD
jgi:dTDP-4-amino-4,6-dideoxygalactose transaminase